jgi:hypothetical protein
MFKRVKSLGALALLVVPAFACAPEDDTGFTFTTGYTSYTTYGTTATTTMAETSGNGDGDGDGDQTGDGDGSPTTTTTGDGDGDGSPTTTGDGDGDGCPAGEFGCPCNNGACAPGLECYPNDTCGLPQGGTTTTTTSTTGNGDDPWDPATCVMPSVEVSITDIEGSLCSAPCVTDADCPDGPVGTQPACALILDMDVDPSQCALICDPLNDTCSPGSSCKAVPNQPDVGICTYP